MTEQLTTLTHFPSGKRDERTSRKNVRSIIENIIDEYILFWGRAL